jgi:hypothetical protein
MDQAVANESMFITTTTTFITPHHEKQRQFNIKYIRSQSMSTLWYSNAAAFEYTLSKLLGVKQFRIGSA